MASLKEYPDLDPEYRYRIARVRIALLLHITPEEVDRMPARDVQDLIEVYNYDTAEAKKAWEK